MMSDLLEEAMEQLQTSDLCRAFFEIHKLGQNTDGSFFSSGGKSYSYGWDYSYGSDKNYDYDVVIYCHSNTEDAHCAGTGGAYCSGRTGRDMSGNEVSLPGQIVFCTDRLNPRYKSEIEAIRSLLAHEFFHLFRGHKPIGEEGKTDTWYGKQQNCEHPICAECFCGGNFDECSKSLDFKIYCIDCLNVKPPRPAPLPPIELVDESQPVDKEPRINSGNCNYWSNRGADCYHPTSCPGGYLRPPGSYSSCYEDCCCANDEDDAMSSCIDVAGGSGWVPYGRQETTCLKCCGLRKEWCDKFASHGARFNTEGSQSCREACCRGLGSQWEADCRMDYDCLCARTGGGRENLPLGLVYDTFLCLDKKHGWQPFTYMAWGFRPEYGKNLIECPPPYVTYPFGGGIALGRIFGGLL
ncbi:MAG: hypothetical protein JRI36_11740 [Deltaproteobacteria bacterium]|nr:hypothetical protein [Deltaproteobacteria bacterium]